MKKILALLLALSLTSAPCAFAISLPAVVEYDGRFDDVAEDAWYYNYVSACFSMGLIAGRSDDRFAPSENITTAEAVKLACELRRAYLQGSEFRSSDPWYRVYFDYALSCGILESEPDAPNEHITRLGFAKLIAAALPESEYPEINLVEDGAIGGLGEDGEEAVYMLYRAGVLTGGENGEFRENDLITRAEAAAVLSRAAEQLFRERFSLTFYTGEVEVDAAAEAQKVFELTNALRAANGLSALGRDEALDEAASLRARELAESYSHTRPDGSSCFTMLDYCGVEYMSAGENIACGFISAQDVFDAWVASPGHAANISGDFDRLGVGCYLEDGVVYWVQLFVR